MRHVRRSCVRGVCATAFCGGIVGTGYAQSYPRVWGIAEHYHLATQEKDLRNRLSWLEITAEGSSLWSATGSYMEVPVPGGVRKMLDEAFVRYTSPQVMVRAGRIRSPFGFNNWSDYFYTPIIQGPLLRSNKLTSTLGIRRPDTGVEFTGGTPDVQVQVAVVDVANDDWQMTPRNADHVVVRAQFAVGGLLAGVSGTTKFGSDTEGSQLAAIDFRWTAPRFIVRGEAARSVGSGPSGSGYSLEVFYRPPRLARTQVGIRTEGFSPVTPSDEMRLHQIGVRQILSSNFALTVNYGLSNRVGVTRDKQGWSAQLMSSVRF